MNPNQQFQNQVTGTYKKQLQNMNPHGSALAQSVNQAQAYAPQQYQQQPYQQPQFNVPQMLHGIGQFLQNIGHPIAQQFNQYHGFNFGGTTNNGVTSVGGSAGQPPHQVGGTLGMDNGKPFGSYNINRQVKGSFGPQGK